jgi:hypothetical protein
MRKCPACGSDIPDDAVVCRFCGEKFGKPAPYAMRPKSGGSQVLLLIMGILALLCFPIGPIFGLVAIILWISYRAKVKSGLAGPDGSATAGLVLGVLGSVLHVIAIIGIVAVMNTPQFGESMVASQLVAFHQAQEEYKKQNGEYATEISELNKQGVKAFIGIAGWFDYKLELKGDGESWSCIARPAKPEDNGYKMHHFYIDQTGVLRSSETEDVGPKSPATPIVGSYQIQGGTDGG